MLQKKKGAGGGIQMKIRNINIQIQQGSIDEVEIFY